MADTKAEDFISGEVDRFNNDTTGTKYEESVQDNTKITPEQSALFSEQALDPYENKHTKAIIEINAGG